MKPKSRGKIDLGPIRTPKAVSGTRPDALGTACGRPSAAQTPIGGRPGRAKGGQEWSESVPGAPQRRSMRLRDHSQDARERRSRRPTQSKALADRFLNVFGRRAEAPKCVSCRPCQCFSDVGRFARRKLMARKNIEKAAVSTSKIEARGVPGRLGRASSSAKTASSSEKARSKCLRGLRKIISGRERGNFERDSATRAPDERAEARGIRTLISESSSGLILVPHR